MSRTVLKSDSYSLFSWNSKPIWYVRTLKHWGCRTSQKTHADLNILKNHLYFTVNVLWECVITDATIEDQSALSCQNRSFEKIQLPWILIYVIALPDLATKEKLEHLILTFTLLAKVKYIRMKNFKWEIYRTLSKEACAQVLLCFSSSLDWLLHNLKTTIL